MDFGVFSPSGRQRKEIYALACVGLRNIHINKSGCKA